MLADPAHRDVARGLGTAHAGVNAPLQTKPLQAMTAMLDGLDDAGVPTERRLLGCYQAAVDKLAGVDIAW